MKIRQILMGASARDASTNMALRAEEGLATIGDVKTFSFHLPDESVEDRVTPLGEIDVGTRHDIIVYHASFGEPLMTQFLLARPEQLVVVYHNITPSGYFLEVAPHFVTGLAWGRYELGLLAPLSRLSIGISEFNAGELRATGHHNVEVLPLGVDPQRLVDEKVDLALARRLEEKFPQGFVLFVSQLLPHKRPDLAIGAVHYLQAVLQQEIGLVIAGPQRMTDFCTTVTTFTQSLPNMKVESLGEISESELATLYRLCICYLNMSDHEGFAVPPLEAMACGAPVIVRNCGAMGTTVDDGGLVLPEEWGPREIAHALAHVVSDEDVRALLRQRGYNRASTFDPRESVSRFVELVKQIS